MNGSAVQLKGKIDTVYKHCCDNFDNYCENNNMKHQQEKTNFNVFLEIFNMYLPGVPKRTDEF